MGVDQKREISWEEAVLDWYDHVYSPLIQVIEETGILKDFPGRTAADLYLWIMDHRYYLEREAGHPVGPTTAVMSYDAEYGRWTRRVRRSLQRLLHQERDGKHGGLLSPRRIRRALAALRPGSDE
jgi:hypothetical protein